MCVAHEYFCGVCLNSVYLCVSMLCVCVCVHACLCVFVHAMELMNKS